MLLSFQPDIRALCPQLIRLTPSALVSPNSVNTKAKGPNQAESKGEQHRGSGLGLGKCLHK